MTHAETYMIDLSAMCVEAPSVGPQSLCADVHRRFAADPGLPAIAVVDDAERPVGVVQRHAFMLQLADAFRRAAFDAKPISWLMDAAPVVLDVSAELATLSARALAAEPAPGATAFLIVRDGRYLGIGTFSCLLRILVDHLQTQALETDAARREAAIANQGKSRFLANMTHELRTPLNGVIGFGQLLEQEAHGPLGANQYKLYAKDIVDSGQHLIAIINDILDLAKIDAGRIDLNERFVDLRDLTGRSLRMVATLAAQKQIRLASATTDRRWSVRADERRLQQALVNLLSNAIKFSPRGAQIGVEIGADAQWLWIEVWDHGCGIAEPDLARLFKPFSQLGNGRQGGMDGTGLGLTITKALMQAHGGDVLLSSEVDVGTRAKLLLPTNRLLPFEFAWSAGSRVEFIDPPEAEAG